MGFARIIFLKEFTRISASYLTTIRPGELIYLNSSMDVRKAVLIFTGTVFVALGVLGIFLPLLPTTVFLLLAAYCYSRSSERFHNWLLNNRLTGGYVKNYKSGRGMSIAQKTTTLIFLWASIGVSIWLLSAAFWATLLLLAIAVGVTTHILWIKTYRPETISAPEEIDLSSTNGTV
jgi:uncharacterized membrane protein YbaN (DUF454 family)